MKKLLIVSFVVLLLTNCNDDLPDKAFKNLTLDKVENYGDFKFIQLGDYVLTLCDGFIAVKNYADPYNPGPCTGITEIKAKLTKYFLFSANRKQLLIWDPAKVNEDALVLDVEDPLNIKLLLKFVPGQRTILAWDDSVLYASENNILKAYYFEQFSSSATISDISSLKISELKLSGFYNNQYAYCLNRILYAEAGGNIYTIDYKDMKNPVVEGIIRVQSNYGFMPYKNYLLLLGNSEVTFIDLTNPLKPVPAKRLYLSYNVTPANVAVGIKGAYLYIGEGTIFKIFDISDINNILFVKAINTDPNNISSFYFFGTYILCKAVDYTWYTPYQNKVYFINNIP